MNHQISPSFWVSLRNNELDRATLRLLAKSISTTTIFEAVHHNEISSSEAAEIMMLQRESNSWIVRLLKSLCYMIFGNV